MTRTPLANLNLPDNLLAIRPAHKLNPQFLDDNIYIVLHERTHATQPTEYVTHVMSTPSLTMHWGHYFTDYAAAMQDFYERS